MKHLLIAIPIIAALLALGCAPSQRPERSPLIKSDPSRGQAPTTQPILFHRTGGIAGTNDRLIVWPDGFVQVDGKLFAPAAARLPQERHQRILALFAGWDKLKPEYLNNNIPDAYTITIHYGTKSVVANDIATDLPQKFRDIFTELEAVAFEAQQQQNDVKPPPASP
jgi:hypothetical protein